MNWDPVAIQWAYQRLQVAEEKRKNVQTALEKACAFLGDRFGKQRDRLLLRGGVLDSDVNANADAGTVLFVAAQVVLRLGQDVEWLLDLDWPKDEQKIITEVRTSAMDWMVAAALAQLPPNLDALVEGVFAVMPCDSDRTPTLRSKIITSLTKTFPEAFPDFAQRPRPHRHRRHRRRRDSSTSSSTATPGNPEDLQHEAEDGDDIGDMEAICAPSIHDDWKTYDPYEWESCKRSVGGDESMLSGRDYGYRPTRSPLTCSRLSKHDRRRPGALGELPAQDQTAYSSWTAPTYSPGIRALNSFYFDHWESFKAVLPYEFQHSHCQTEMGAQLIEPARKCQAQAASSSEEVWEWLVERFRDSTLGYQGLVFDGQVRAFVIGMIHGPKYLADMYSRAETTQECTAVVEGLRSIASIAASASRPELMPAEDALYVAKRLLVQDTSLREYWKAAQLCSWASVLGELLRGKAAAETLTEEESCVTSDALEQIVGMLSWSLKTPTNYAGAMYDGVLAAQQILQDTQQIPTTWKLKQSALVAILEQVREYMSGTYEVQTESAVSELHHQLSSEPYEML